MEEAKNGRRERRRRKPWAADVEFERAAERGEPPTEGHATQSSRKLVRRDTYSVVRSRSEAEAEAASASASAAARSPGGPGGGGAGSGPWAFGGSDASERSVRRRSEAGGRSESKEVRPVPAPRKRKFESREAEKVSSDTDRDVTEIDLDDPRAKWESSPPAQALLDDRPSSESAESKSVVVPVPKPRKTAKSVQRQESTSERSNGQEPESPDKRTPSQVETFEETIDKLKDTHDTDADSPGPPNPNELPLLADLQEEAKSPEAKQKPKKQRRTIGDLLERRGKKKKSKTFSALMKLERKKIPKIPSILRDLKDEEGGKGEKDEKGGGDAEEDKLEFQMPSRPYAESVHNGQIYVQGKNGFRARGMEEVLGSGSGRGEKGGSEGMTPDSTANAALLIQKYWSRTMTYFHGVLAGLGFSHAATVTAIMLHCNYDPRQFVGVYSCLSLKIHYAFYTLTTLCIVSCFDRIDIGHMNRKHWDDAWRAPSAWVVLLLYAIAFALTLANQLTEARFDALPAANHTDLWPAHTPTDIQVHLLQWYHAVWARDVLVLLAWLLVALTTFDDLLLSHIANMACFAEPKGEDKVLRRL